jgi:hypothetical protein
MMRFLSDFSFKFVSEVAERRRKIIAESGHATLMRPMINVNDR